MFSGNFLYFNTLLLVIILYCETFFGIFFKNIWKQLKNLIITSTKNNLQTNSLNLLIINFMYVILVIFFITLKSSNTLPLLPVIFTIFFTKNIFTKNYNHMFISINILITSLLFIYIHNFITFFIILEFYSILFYFYLLNTSNTKELLLIKYKNNLLLYLFNNFLISIFFMFFISQIIYSYGTVNFHELTLFFYQNNIFFILLLLSLLIKLSLPGFHYLKIEMYKYITLENVIIFSITTLFVNFLLINFLFTTNLLTNIFSMYKILITVPLISIFIFIQKLKVNSINEFVAYSGFATNNLILLNFLI